MTRKEIMIRAHEIARAAVKRFGGKHSEYMSEALKMAWEESRMPQTVQELLRCPPDRLYDYLRRSAARCPYWAEIQTRPVMIDGEPARDPKTGKILRQSCPGAWALWMVPASKGGLGREAWEDAVEMVAAESWLILADMPADMDSREACRKAATKACQRLNRQTIDKPSRQQQDPSSLDDPNFNKRLTTRRENPETVAIQRSEITGYVSGRIDKIIINGLLDGLTQAAIAEKAGISQGMVSRRLRAIRDRRAADDLAQQANDLDAAVLRAAGMSYNRSPAWRPDNASSSPGSR